MVLAGMFGFSLVGGFLAARVFGGGPVGVGLVWLVWAVVAVVVLVGARVARRSIEPVQNLVDAAGRLADGDYAVRVPKCGPPPVSRAADSFNTMAERLENADRQRRQLLADVGHELRTPLAIIRGEMEAMVDGVRPISAETVDGLLADIDVMERLLEDLRVLSTAESGRLVLQTEPTDLRDLADDLVQDLTPQAAAAEVALSLQPGPEVHTDVDPVRIKGILGNLVVNAIRATPPGGRVDVSVGHGAEAVTVRVADTGVGIPPEELDRVFDRFHKGAGSGGSGLGLTISRQYARAHGGDLRAAPREGGGSVFTLSLPPV